MAPAAELVIFTATEAYRGDRSVSAPLEKLLATKAGFLKVLHGLQVEDPTKGYLVILWETVEHHIAITKEESYSQVLEAAGHIIGSDSEIVHVRFTTDPTPVLSAPVVEFVLTTLNEGQSRDEAAPHFEKLGELSANMGVGSAWGNVVENQNQVVSFVGWSSLEAHTAALTNATEDFRVLGTNLMSIATFKVAHSKLGKA